MALKCLNPDSIPPLTGRPKSSALCSVDNTSSLVYRVPIRSRLIPRTASVRLSTFIPLRFITSSYLARAVNVQPSAYRIDPRTNAQGDHSDQLQRCRFFPTGPAEKSYWP